MGKKKYLTCIADVIKNIRQTNGKKEKQIIMIVIFKKKKVSEPFQLITAQKPTLKPRHDSILITRPTRGSSGMFFAGAGSGTGTHLLTTILYNM